MPIACFDRQPRPRHAVRWGVYTSRGRRAVQPYHRGRGGKCGLAGLAATRRRLRLHRYPLRTNFCRHLQSGGTKPCLTPAAKTTSPT